MADYVRRYERVAWELKTAGGGEIAEKVRGWHILGQARLLELEEKVVVGTYHTQEGYDYIKWGLVRISGKKGKKEATE